MASSSQIPEPSAADAMLAALTAGAGDRPESRVLDSLVGDWRATTEWEPIVGHGVRRSQSRVETRWIFGNRLVESRTFTAEGIESAKLLCAFDPTVGDYVAFAVNTFSTSFTLERGDHDPAARTLTLDGWEPVPDGRPSVRYRRTFELAGPDRHTSSITYPDVPPGTFGPMFISYARMA